MTANFEIVDEIAIFTFAVSFITSWFQNLNTDHPSASSLFVLSASFFCFFGIL